MTKRERDRLREAIRLIHDDTGEGEPGYFDGMNILADLAGLGRPNRETQPTTIQEVMRATHPDLSPPVSPVAAPG